MHPSLVWMVRVGVLHGLLGESVVVLHLLLLFDGKHPTLCLSGYHLIGHTSRHGNINQYNNTPIPSLDGYGSGGIMFACGISGYFDSKDGNNV